MELLANTNDYTAQVPIPPYHVNSHRAVGSSKTTRLIGNSRNAVAQIHTWGLAMTAFRPNISGTVCNTLLGRRLGLMIPLRRRTEAEKGPTRPAGRALGRVADAVPWRASPPVVSSPPYLPRGLLFIALLRDSALLLGNAAHKLTMLKPLDPSCIRRAEPWAVSWLSGVHAV